MIGKLNRCLALTVMVAASVVGVDQARAAAASGPATIDENGYVRLEVVLTTTSPNPVMKFQSACPKKSLWGVDLKQLLSGSKHATLDVAITSPEMGPIPLTPLSIDKKSSGLLGLGKSCDVTIDQMRYLSPAYYVKSYNNAQFTVAPTFKQTTAVNPGLTTTLDTALALALNLASVPAKTAAPYKGQLDAILGQVSVSGNETFIKHPIIRPGPVPTDSAFQWTTSGLFTASDGSAPLDVVLIARLVPTATLIPDPPPGPDGKIVWTPANVLTAPFATNLVPGSAGTLGSFMTTAVPGDIANYRAATTKDAASNACDPILAKVQTMGLSERDQALLMWAVTHNHPSPNLTKFDVDNLQCLDAAWTLAPPELKASRETTAPVITPAPSPGVPPTSKQMKIAIELDDAFAVFFKTGLWTERRKFGASLFRYPAKYADADGLLFDSSSTLDNVDQWLALHTASTPIADRVGCYSYVPATDSSGKSVMYAIADTVAGRSAPQALLIATFGNVSGNADPKIETLEVTASVSPGQKKAILQAQGGQCLSGYKPALVFGGQ